jgi:hypothetical protein
MVANVAKGVSMKWNVDLSLDPAHEFAIHDGKTLCVSYNENTGIVYGSVDGPGEFDHARVTLDTQRGCDPDFEMMKRILEEIVNNPFKEQA